MTKQQIELISCSNISKCFRIYESPKARLKQALWGGRKQYYREFWALKNINFSVKEGESYGIIGRNGSGKSTLLQLICGTLTPTEGSIATKGKVAALLELGSGFNPEFTGIENIYLNASMLGLSKEQTDDQIDNILSFAEIGDFAYQPVKTYSSGMSVRLAFAVIAHVNADILVIDEALAVGDAIFVQRCMRFIRNVREEKCLLFVSHSDEAIKSLCSHAIWLSEGETKSQGKCRDVTLDYLRYCQASTYGQGITVTALDYQKNKKSLGNTSSKSEFNPTKEQQLNIIDSDTQITLKDNLSNSRGWKTGDANLTSLDIQIVNRIQHNGVLNGGELIEITIKAKANKKICKPILGFIVKNKLGQDIFGENTLNATSQSKEKNTIANPGDEIKASFKLWMPMLASGDYMMMASIADGDLIENTQHHWVEDGLLLKVSSNQIRYGLAGAFISTVDLSIKTK